MLKFNLRGTLLSETKMSHSQTQCAVQACKTTIFKKGIGVTFHQFPTDKEIRNKWYLMLRNRCGNLDWTKSKICSTHFESRCFTSQRKLRENAVPTIFPTKPGSSNQLASSKTSDTDSVPRNKVDRLLNKLTQSVLVQDIQNTMSLIKVPDNYSDCVTDDLQCVPETPVEAQLWLLIKKQDHLITRLMQVVTQNKKHVEVLQKNMEESRTAKKEMEQNVETYKYIVKCLQEKHASLEEQIEILTAVESR